MNIFFLFNRIRDQSAILGNTECLKFYKIKKNLKIGIKIIKIFLLKLKPLIKGLYTGLNKNISLKLNIFQKLNIFLFSKKSYIKIL